VKETVRVAPLSAYPFLTACLLASSALSNVALNYINFPTKVVFRSCKLIPTMVVATIVHRKVFTLTEYLCALAVCAGLIFFAAADWSLTPTFHPIGLIFVSLSVCADAILPNAQEGLFRIGSSRVEVTYYTNVFTLVAMTVMTLLSGDLLGLISLARNNNKLQAYMCIYTFIAFIAISLHMSVVKKFGGVAAVVLATGRKGLTLVLSFVLFPKAFSWFYVVGAALVLGGLLIQSLAHIRAKKKKQESADVEATAPANNKPQKLKQSPMASKGPPTKEPFSSNQDDRDLENSAFIELPSTHITQNGGWNSNRKPELPTRDGSRSRRHIHDQ
jgi:solute carrier family 35 (adenosine 3'-phospho 5'-phosphosulfate transporter), member B3